MENELEARVQRKLVAVRFAGEIILYPANKIVPIGWAVCNGSLGTPALTPPAGTVYIIKT